MRARARLPAAGGLPYPPGPGHRTPCLPVADFPKYRQPTSARRHEGNAHETDLAALVCSLLLVAAARPAPAMPVAGGQSRTTTPAAPLPGGGQARQRLLRSIGSNDRRNFCRAGASGDRSSCSRSPTSNMRNQCRSVSAAAAAPAAAVDLRQRRPQPLPGGVQTTRAPAESIGNSDRRQLLPRVAGPIARLRVDLRR